MAVVKQFVCDRPDYDTVGESPAVDTGQGLGDAFAPDVRATWAEIYGLLAGVMEEAAYG